MRRMMFSLLAVGFLGALSGCCTSHSHGNCDCEEDDHCSGRAPWMRYAPSVADTHSSEPIAPPAKAMPDGKTKKL